MFAVGRKTSGCGSRHQSSRVGFLSLVFLLPWCATVRPGLSDILCGKGKETWRGLSCLLGQPWSRRSSCPLLDGLLLVSVKSFKNSWFAIWVTTRGGKVRHTKPALWMPSSCQLRLGKQRHYIPPTPCHSCSHFSLPQGPDFSGDAYYSLGAAHRKPNFIVARSSKGTAGLRLAAVLGNAFAWPRAKRAACRLSSLCKKY